MNKYDIAAFIWPSYTGDEPRSRIFWPEGYGEWQTVKAMTDKGGYEGCRWPRKPLWGYVNEADKSVMEMQIKAAVSHGVNVFIYDWYWYDDRPFLENCLNDGFLKADNNTDMKFYLMWANHDATHLWDKRNSHDLDTVIWKGTVNRQIFSKICDRTIEKYFKKSNYYQIDGCPVYMIFEFKNFLDSFESLDECKNAVDEFRQKTVQAGFNGLHFQVALFNNFTYKAKKENDKANGMTASEIMKYIGVDSFSSYNWACVMNVDKDYSDVREEYFGRICDEYQTYGTPYYPNITVGWDNNLRFEKFIKGVMKNNTPDEFEKACKDAKNYIDNHISKDITAPLITVNSWNEWTETSYLQPDDLYGYGYLEKIKDVFM